MNKLYTSFLALLSTTIFCPSLAAQIKEGKFINFSAGFGTSAPYDQTDISGTGFYAQGEYVLNVENWLGVRPYAGVIIASGDSDAEGMEGYEMKSNAFLLGIKGRIAAPIPYVAPFIELGLGASVGSFRTYTPKTDLKKSGVLLHVPFTLGLALGRKNDVELKFTYYYHTAVEQFSGAAALGLSFPLKD